MRNEVNGDLICRSALFDEIDGIYKRHYANSAYQFIHDFFRAIFRRINKAPAVDAVSRLVVEHIKWERDTAIQQLKDHGIPFGGTAPDVVEVVRCKDCKWLYDGKDMYCCTNHTGLALIKPDGSSFCSYGERKQGDTNG